MTCPKCNGKVGVLYTLQVDNNEIYRKRKCQECNHVFYTSEFEVEYDETFRELWTKYTVIQQKNKEKRK